MDRQTQQQEFNSIRTKIEEQNFTNHDNGMLQSVEIIDSDGTDPTLNESYLYNTSGQRIIKQSTDGTNSSMTK